MFSVLPLHVVVVLVLVVVGLVATSQALPIHVTPSANTVRVTLTQAGRTPKMHEPMTSERQGLMKARELRRTHIAVQNSVNGPGIKRPSEEPKLTRPDIDDSILSAVLDVFELTEGPEPVYIATKYLVKEEFRLLEHSPISVLETAKKPSTQALSITDEEEPVAQTKSKCQSDSMPTISEHQDLQSDNLAKNHHPQLAGSQDLALPDSKKGVLKEAASIDKPQNLSQHSAHWYDRPAFQTSLVTLTVVIASGFVLVIPIYRLFVGSTLLFIYS